MTAGDRPRIALFIPTLAGGGVEQNMIHLSRAFADAGHAVDLVVGSARGPRRDAVDGRVRLVDLGASRVLFALPGLVRYLKRNRPGVLLSGMMHANLVALAARHLSGAGTAVYPSEHTVLSGRLAALSGPVRFVMTRLARRLYPGADGIVAVSRAVADDLCRLADLPRASVTVIGNPVVTPGFLAALGDRPDHPFFGTDAPPVVISAGRLVPGKAFDVLVAAFARLRESRAARLLILGEGPERAALLRQAEDLGVSADVDLPGHVPSVAGFLGRAAVFALPSRVEGFGNALVEALAAGLPVVATTCPGGPSDILEDGRHGALVSPDDARALERALAAALDEPGAPEPRRARAGDFAVDRIAGWYLALFGPAEG